MFGSNALNGQTNLWVPFSKMLTLSCDEDRAIFNNHRFAHGRELNKAYAGWAPLIGMATGPMPPVATGNWGCGAFGGDKRLKALLQLMVCVRVGRPLVYYTFGDRELRTELLAVWRWLRRERVTVGECGGVGSLTGPFG